MNLDGLLRRASSSAICLRMNGWALGENACVLHPPGIPGFDSEITPEAMLARAVETNVRWSMRQILESPEGRERGAEGRVKLIGAICEIETGRARFLS